MKTIPLTQNKYATVDDSDYMDLSVFKWTFSKGYAVRMEKKPYKTGKRRMLYMHTELLGDMVDHKDGNGLNNARSNLRHCTPAENMRNRKMAQRTKSGYKGVWFNSKRNKFVAYIKLDGVSIVLRSCDTAEEAAYIYDQASLQLWGEFARPNFG